MIRKNEIVALAKEVQAYAPNETVVAAGTTALILHGVMEATTHAHFHVSATMFETIRAARHSVVATMEGRRMIQVGFAVWVHEGPYLDTTHVEGVKVYTLNGLRVRYELQGQGTQPGALEARCLAGDIARHQVKMDELAAAPVGSAVPVKVLPSWGELTEAEQAYEARCVRADWYYSYSDDITVYRAGKESCNLLKAEADREGGKYSQIYKYYSTK